MENVLGSNELKAFIDNSGILIKIVNLDLGGNSVEIVAESILKYLEKEASFMCEVHIKKRGSYQQYLIENYNYVYIHLCYLSDRIDMKEIKAPSNPDFVSDKQRKKILELCKGNITTGELPKLLEKKK